MSNAGSGTHTNFLTVNEECDYQLVLLYEMKEHWSGVFGIQKSNVYNLRAEYKLQTRRNTFDLVAKDSVSGSILTDNTSLDGQAGKTKNGFYLDTAGSKFYNVSYRKDGGAWTNLNNRLTWNATLAFKGAEDAQYGAEVAYSSGSNINQLGDYRLRFSNGLTQYIREFTVGDFSPTKNFEALGNAPQTNPWNRHSRGYGGKLADGKIYLYSSESLGRSSLGTLIYDKEVSRSGNNYVFNGQTYSSNDSVMQAVNAKAEQIFKTYNYDPTVSETWVLMDDGLKEGTLKLNGFTFYQYAEIYSKKLFCYKLTGNESYNLDDINVVAGLIANCSELSYGVTMENQTVELSSERYVIIEQNVFGKNKAFYATYMIENVGVVKLQLNAIAGGQQERTYSRASDMEKATVQSFTLKSYENALDSDALLKVATNNAVQYFYSWEVNQNGFTAIGNYQISFYDRYNHTISFEVEIVATEGNGIAIEGAENGGDAVSSAVTVYFSSEWSFEMGSYGDELFEPEVTLLSDGRKKFTLYPAQEDRDYYIVLSSASQGEYELFISISAIS